MTRPVSILHVITRLVPGGAQDSTIAACEQMARRGYEVALACAPEAERVSEARERGIRVITVPSFRREVCPWHDLRAFIRLLGIIRAGRYDVVHTHTSKAGVLGRVAARLAGTPVVVHSPHGSIFSSHYYGRAGLATIAWVERSAGLFADRIIPLAQGALEDYLRHRLAPRRKYTLVYTGMEVDRFKGARVDLRAKRVQLGLPPAVPVIGMIAQLTPEKGHDIALRAFSQVVKTVPDARLLIVGEGNQRGAIEQDIRDLGLGFHTVLTGYRKDIPEILSAVDISLHPSHMDGLPRSLVEAMLAGKPVVATSVGGIPEVACDGETALLVEPGDSCALAAALLRLLGDVDLARRLGEQGRESASGRFSLDRMVDEWLGVYKDAFRGKGLRELCAGSVCLETIPCPMCGRLDSRRLARVRSSPIPVLTWLVGCRSCGLSYVSPRADRRTEEDFYRSQYYEATPPRVWDEGRVGLFTGLIRMVEKLSPEKGRLLDAGCGNGAFLALAVSRGWSVSGVDLSARAAREARGKGLAVVEGKLEDSGLEAGSLDVVTAWNVLDQAADPMAELSEAMRVLKPGGLLALRVSNRVFQEGVHRAALCLAGGRALSSDPAVFHNVLFDSRTVRQFLARAGFTGIRVADSRLGESVPAVSRLFGGEGENIVRVLVSAVSAVVRVLTLGALLVGPSLIVTARRPHDS